MHQTQFASPTGSAFLSASEHSMKYQKKPGTADVSMPHRMLQNELKTMCIVQHKDNHSIIQHLVSPLSKTYCILKYCADTVYEYSSYMTLLIRRPMCSISSSIRSPALSTCGGFIANPTPCGVPVRMMSPG